jgi:hypothetical protein
MKLEAAAGLGICLALSMAADAAEPVNADYVRSLAAPGKTVLVLEYYDGQPGRCCRTKGVCICDRL